LAFDDLNRTVPGTVNDPDDPPERRYWLEYGDQTIELRAGTVQVGRSSACHVVLDDALVSRRHAQFVVGRGVVTLEDLGSVNGVFLNSRRIKEPQQLRDGDRVQIGKAEFVLRSSEAGLERPRDLRRTAETLNHIELPADLLRRQALARGAGKAADTAPPPPPAQHEAASGSSARYGSAPSQGEGEEPTRERDAMDLLGMVADKVLVLGRGEEAERILSNMLNNVLADARAPRAVTPRSAERAVAYAMKLAEASGKARWLDYVFELYLALKRPLPAPVVDQLYTLVRKVNGTNLTTLRTYLTTLQGLAHQLGPSERFVLQRLEGLERLAAR
jgi:pSer/pThr/pTyr-binding forkhead associated (FHA) protein